MPRHDPLLVGILAAAVTSFLLPAAAWAARRGGLLSRPGGRVVHAGAVPLLGGVAVLLPPVLVLAGQALSAGLPFADIAVPAAVAVAFAVGLLDDGYTLAPRWKVAGLLVAAVLLAAGGARFPGVDGVLGSGCAVLWTVLLANAINVVDGQDGVAGVSIGVLALGVLLAGGPPWLAASVLGSVLAFLRVNLPPARILLGDAGSLGLGVLAAALTMTLPASAGAPLVLALGAYPLTDLGFVTVRRILRGKPPWVGDRGHTYHRLAAWRGGPGRALVPIALFALLALAAGLYLPPSWACVVLGLLPLALGLLLARKTGSPFRDVLRERPRIRALHRARARALRVLVRATGPEAVRAALERAAADLEVDGLEVGGLRIERRLPAEGDAEERVETAAGTARWWAQAEEAPRLWDRERRYAMAELLRRAAAR